MDHKKVEMFVVGLKKKYPLVDAGNSLSTQVFNKDRFDVVIRAQTAGILSMIINGESIETSTIASQFCDEVDDLPLYFTAGISPQYVDQYDKDQLKQLRSLVTTSPRCVGIGVCGLDPNKSTQENNIQRKQIACFKEQVKLAVELKLPFNINYWRHSHFQLLEILDQIKPNIPIVIQNFQGSEKDLEAYLQRGFFISITGFICNQNRQLQWIEEAIKNIPNDKLLLSTCAPNYVPWNVGNFSTRPHRNEPGCLPAVLQRVAHIRGQSLQEVAFNSTMVAQQLYQLEI